MLVEDVVGFGLLRTGMDLRRNKMYGDDTLNVPAAAERFGREILSILTDCVLGGVVAWGVGKAVFDRKNQAFSSQFIQYPSLELFEDIAKSEALKQATCANSAQKLFTQALAERIVLKDGQSLLPQVEEAFNAVWNRNADPKTIPDRKTINGQAKALVKALNKEAKDFTVDLKVENKTGKKATFAANELLDDVSRFSSSMAEAWKNKGTQGTTWQAMAEKAIGRTLTAKNRTLPIGLAAGMATTFASSFLLNGLTKKFSGIDYFPGETSLRKQQAKPGQNNPQGVPKSFWEQHFPYVGEALKSGNPLPLVGALVPLLAAVGAFDTYNRRFINPIKGLKEGTLKKLFDYTKAWPFTSQQQMAAMFALLITSRLLSSRSDNEYKERILDSAVGWGAWIIGTPLLKQGVSKLLDRKLLLTQAGALKSREAVEAFSREALSKNVWVGIVSTLGTIGTLGLLAPWAGIKLTQWNEKRKQEKAALNQPTQLQAMPALASVAPKAFLPTPMSSNPFVPGMTRPMIASQQANTFPAYSPNYAWPQRPNQGFDFTGLPSA